MDQTVKTKDTPVPAHKGSTLEHQKTVLLSETPVAPNAVRTSGVRGSSSGNSVSPNLNLSSSSLAALSQRYDVLSEAGHGNMGNVYKARDRETGETVALKLIKPEIASDQAMTERFKNELLFARRITHKNVCRVYEFNRVGGIAYTSMEFVEGESLRSVFSRFGGLPVRKGVDLALQICSGLREAHAQGIVHRDLKPENVMIDAQGNVKIMDFGIARSMEAGTRLTGAMIGTPAYMAPEQVSGKPVDYRTDVYALGLILYEMFTGTETFRADTPVAMALKQMQETPAPPHDIDPSIPVYIERAILKCLEKEPSKRFQSIAELESALRSTRTTGTPIVSGGPAARVSPQPAAERVTATPQIQEPLTLKTERKFPIAWVIGPLAAIFIIVGGLKAMQITKLAAQIQPPSVSSAPVPPREAFVIPLRPPVEKTPAAVSAKPSPPEVFPRMEWGHRTPRSASDPNTYILVGRFERQDRAQDAAKRIEDQNLQVDIKPRQGLGNQQFFVVLTGPFQPSEAQRVLDWLKAVGFPKAHKVDTRQNQNHAGKRSVSQN